LVTCPLCTKIGLLLIGIGFAFMFLGSFRVLPVQYSMWISLGFIISAYIIPNFMKTDTCRDGTCNSNQKTR
jgi:hypothetical protein